MKRDPILAIRLPAADGRMAEFAVHEPRRFERPARPFTRIAYAAAHVVADPLSTKEPWLEPAIDWEATLAFRRHLWSWGLAVAEAMDTAQRGMGLDWPNALELIRRSVAEAKGIAGARIACGAGTDQLAPGPHPLERIVAAYEEQCEAIERAG
ncbi:MAG: dihydrodipicolinate synthase family protein, partial [Elioraea sp.]|nr:dihydrodipicolinate synthase family protein [Elioraea sp.]